MTTIISDEIITAPELTLTGSQPAALVYASPGAAAGAPALISLSYQHIYGAGGVTGGYPILDASQLVLTSNLPVVPIAKGGTGATTAAGAIANLGLTEAVQFAGTWNASSNVVSPGGGSLASGVGNPGYAYKVTTAGTTTLDGIASWSVGDQAVFSGVSNTWNKIDGQPSDVLSVAGRTGAVVLSYSDVSGVAALNVAQTFTKSQSATITTLTYAATMTLDLMASNDAQVTLTGNVTFANPTSLTPGTTGVIDIIQDGTGGRTATFGSSWRFGAAGAPALSAAAGAVDTLFYSVRSATRIVATILNATT